MTGSRTREEREELLTSLFAEAEAHISDENDCKSTIETRLSIAQLLAEEKEPDLERMADNQYCIYQACRSIKLSDRPAEAALERAEGYLLELLNKIPRKPSAITNLEQTFFPHADPGDSIRRKLASYHSEHAALLRELAEKQLVLAREVRAGIYLPNATDEQNEEADRKNSANPNRRS
jgi:hypothetical protein